MPKNNEGYTKKTTTTTMKKSETEGFRTKNLLFV